MTFWRIQSTLLAIICLFVPGPGAPAQERAADPPLSVTQLFSRGYELLRTAPSEAIPFFEEIVRRDSTNPLAQRQLGSLYLNSGRQGEALDRFLAAHRLAPTDSSLLQIAYLYHSLGETRKALATFGTLQGSPNPGIAATSRRAVDMLTPAYCAERSIWWSRVTGSVYYDQRFEDVIASFSALVGRSLSENRTFSLYGALTINKDSRSTGGERPVIYSDNYALAGAGLRIQPVRNWTIDLQPGLTFDLLERPGEERWKSDFRAVTTIGTGIYPGVELPSRLRAPGTFLSDIFLSYGYYSRYTNSIGYGQARAGIRALAYRHSALDLYLRGDVTFDTDREFFNNTLEGSIGARLTPDHTWGVGILAEVHRGLYLIAPGPGVRRWYSSFRLLLVADRFLCL